MAQSAASVEVITKEKKPRPFLWDMIVRLVKEKPLATFGGVIVILLFLVGIFASFIAPHGYNEMILADRLQAPSVKYWLGTDNLGRDLLSRIIFGAQISMIVGLSVPAISGVGSLLLGTVSAYFGGKTDLIIQRFVDTVMCFPGLVIMLTVIAITGPGMVQLILLLGILGAVGGQVRVMRSAVLGVMGNMYLDASKAVGCSNWRIMYKHILPNIMAVVIVTFSMGMGGAILAEATLSFLGFGIPPPAPSWGGMLSGPARRYMLQAPWMALWPGLALAIVVYGMNMLGDGIRDVLDPRLRGGLGRYGRKVKKKAEEA
jgi:peptide/nickel transport system permease protein